MTLNGSRRPNVDEVLNRLKDFQRSTVEHIFRRLYLDPDGVSRFLIADEVGLGKTLVARGIIAKAVDYLWDIVPRIDVVYICSNQDIAQQNIDRLNINPDRNFQFASRATLLPVVLQKLGKLNFVALTPGTSFNLRSRSGWKRERAVLYALLREHWGVPEGPLRNVLRGDVRKENWRAYLDWFERDLKRNLEPGLDEELKQAFCKALDQAPALRVQYDAVAEQIGSRRKHLSEEMRSERNRLIGALRRVLARSSLHALEPDLVILDEFQRFKYLLDDKGDVAPLARELFDFLDVKVLLLSATPYKMYTLQGEAGEDHYKDFYDTVQFLFKGQPEALQQLEAAVKRYRSAMLHLSGDGHRKLQEAKATIERILCRVMVRTERLAASVDRNDMLAEIFTAQDQVHPDDLARFVHLDHIARAVDAGDQVEYWKSSAYPLNLMEDYKLKRKFKDALKGPGASKVIDLLRKAQRHLLSWDAIQAYQAIDPGNARLRALWQDSVETENWQLLWMPPSLPYYRPNGPFSEVKAEGCTKTLVFSAWKLVPKAIAMLLSYEAERRMLEERGRNFAYAELTDKRKPLLTFTRSRGRLTGLPVFCLIYPCLTLAQDVDPLTIARGLNETTPSHQAVFETAKIQICKLLDEAKTEAETHISTKRSRRPDERWYWAALALLDRHFHRQDVERWVSMEEEPLAWGKTLDEASVDSAGKEEGEARRFAEHVRKFKDFFQNLEQEPGGTGSHPAAQLRFKELFQNSEQELLGEQPEDLLDVLTYIALSGPAVVSLRAMLRIMRPQVCEQWPVFLAAAARVGLAFRTLFNQPDVISLLQRFYLQDVYWRKVLRYCFDGNLQAVMDEYVHVLYESLGLVGHDPAESVEKLSATVQRALSLRAPTLRFDEVVLGGKGHPTIEKRGIRCRYALRFGDERSADYDGRTRDVDVRIAFNSPFRPFVLATTSIGQEGLDFHQYCHRVIHWNLPSNPVDLEQREGRVHRYKGHVIRRNLALRYGLSLPGEDTVLVDFWQRLFEQAVEDRPPEANDLVPFWIYEVDDSEGRALKIERKVPVLPLSREIGRMKQLKKSLVAYRSVIGQPRQQELLDFLSARLNEDEIQEFVESVTIDLSPSRE
jgi:hypothetical protein